VSIDVALLSLGTTPGLRRADDAFGTLLGELGLECRMVRVAVGRAGHLRRHPAATDLVEALAARRSAGHLPAARAVVISTVTAGLLHRPRVPYAIRFDAPAALNRPGLAGAWQRAAERAAVRQAPLLLPWSAEAGAALREGHGRVVPVAVPVERIVGATERDIDAIAYAGYPRKRGLDVLCAAWGAIGAPGRLVIGGVDGAKGRTWLERCGVAEPPGVEWVGALPRDRWLETVARARVYVNASRFEDHGLAQLEALSAGAALVTVPSPGPHPPLRLARALAPSLVAPELSAPVLADALRAGLSLSDDERAAYAARADELLREHRAEAIRAVVEREVLPALGLR
jgi:Glycosyl transferases group 1